MSDATKSDKSAEDLFHNVSEQGLSAFLPLSDDACSFTSGCNGPESEMTVAPPDDSILLSPPIFSTQREEKTNEQEKGDSTQIDSILETEVLKKPELTAPPSADDNELSMEQPAGNETAEGFLAELRQVCKIAADSLSAQELEQEEQKKIQDKEVDPEDLKGEEIPQEEQTGAQGLLQELETLNILSELNRKKAKKPAKSQDAPEENSVSGDLLAQLNTLSETSQKTESSHKKEKRKKSARNNNAVSRRKKRMIAASVAVGCIVFFAILFQFIGFALINGASMTPSLSEHDFIIYWKLPGEIKREEVIVSRAAGYENQIIAKRVIGLPGDIVEVDQQGRVILNGEPYSETKAIYGDAQIAGDVQFPVEVEQNRYFVLGDNRAVSVDSRVSTIGQIAQKDILGEVICWFHIE